MQSSLATSGLWSKPVQDVDYDALYCTHPLLTVIDVAEGGKHVRKPCFIQPTRFKKERWVQIINRTDLAAKKMIVEAQIMSTTFQGDNICFGTPLPARIQFFGVDCFRASPAMSKEGN